MDISDVKAKYPGSETFVFGDSRELCEELTSLVLSGARTATCDSFSVYESGKEKMPAVGRVAIATTWDCRPAVAIRTLEVEVKMLNEVEERFALDEGENDSLDGWRRDHKEYFARNGGFNSDMKLGHLCKSRERTA